MSEQDRFVAMQRDHVAPALRAMGFRGSGQRFVLPDEDWWIVVGFQRSRWNDASSVQFTVNLTLADKSAWERFRTDESWIPAQPAANLHYPVGRTIRLGPLMPVRADQWWKLTSREDPSALGAEVVDAIRTYGVPWIRGQIAAEIARSESATDQTS